MDLWELFLIALVVSVDAFAISICKGLSVQKISVRHWVITGLWFGGAQAVMPLLGYLLGNGFHRWIESVDHWISFALLILIGINMIKESREESKCLDCSFAVKAMLPLAIADSIDALAVGVVFAFEDVSILPAVALIGCTTFIFSAVGIKIGNLFGERYRAKAECIGGIVLILLGIFFLLEDLHIFG